MNGNAQETASATEELRRGLARAVDTIRQLKARIETGDKHQPIAVLGIGCRLPGGADNPKRFWRLLRTGGDAITDMPRDRLYGTDYFDPDPDKPGKAYVMRGGFIDDPDLFDPGLFGLSPREAAGMDPQQRIALETAWEALENAAIAPDSLKGSRLGVFMGASTNDYVRLRQQFCDPATVDAYQFFGEISFIPGRIAYTLGTHGPAALIDTSCSSSLVAIHQACRSLREGESDLALAGGVSLILSPYGFILVSKLRAVSPDGRCKAFDAGANGYGRGEGCVVLTLKRLADAIRDQDPILAVIQGTAINHDGPSSGITVPNIYAQQDVITRALADGRVSPDQIDYVEAHGTGTDLGDPIELKALDTVVGTGSGRDRPLLVGSVKTNIGHLEPVAGAAGLTKLVLSLQHGEVPPHINLTRRNPKIEWDSFTIDVPTAVTPWPAGEKPRFAGINSFGVTGTNAHAVVGEAPPRPRPAATVARPWQVITISGRGEAPRRQIAGRYERFIAENPDIPLADICLTANTGRARLEHRFAAVTDRPDSLRAQLASYAARKLPANAVEGIVKPGVTPPLALLFPGQGSQYAGMGRELYATEPVFRAALDRCADILDPMIGRSLRDLIFAEGREAEAQLAQTHYTQPAIFAVEYGLSELWRHWDVRPAALLGHSFGEVAAACFADALDLADAIRLVEARGRLAQALLPAGGKMFAINASETEVLEQIRDLDASSVEIAAVNSPEDIVIAGDDGEVTAVSEAFSSRGVRVKYLAISHAFHTRTTEPMLGAFREVVASLTFRQPRLPIVASVTGRFHTADSLGDPDYWCRHTRQAVRFNDGVATLIESGIEVFLEVGADSVLLPMVGRHEAIAGKTVIASQTREDPGCRDIRMAAAKLFVAGIDLDWARIHDGDGAQRIAIPTYAFQHDRFWFDLPKRSGAGFSDHDGGEAGPVLPGRRVEAPDPVFTTTLDADDLLALGGREEDGLVVLPGYALGLLPTAAAAAISETGIGITIDSVAPVLALNRDDELSLHTVLTTLDEGGWRLRSHALSRAGARTGEGWQAVLDARLVPGLTVVADPLPTVSDQESQEVPDTLTGLGIGAIRRNGTDTLVEFADPVPAAAALDIALSAALAPPQTVTLSRVAALAGRSPMPAIRQVVVRGQPWRWGEIPACGATLYDRQGQPALALEGIALTEPPSVLRLADELPLPDIFYSLDWEERPRKADPADRPGRALIYPDRRGIARALADTLTARGWKARIWPGVDTDDGAPSADPADIAAALAEAYAPDGDQPTHLFFLPGLDLAAAGATTMAALAEGRSSGTEPAVAIVQALASLPTPPSVRLWIATEGAQPAGPAARPLQVTAAPLWGLGKAIALEHAEIWGGLVDLDPGDPDSHLALVDEVLRPDIEDLVAFRDGRRYVQRLNRWDPARLPSRPIRPSASGWYLITGGLGGIGLSIARWLIDAGASHIAITGRSALAEGPGSETDSKVQAVHKLRQSGAEIRYFAADVCSATDMDGVIGTLSAFSGGLKGIFHAAGLSKPQDLIVADAATFAEVMRPKVEGAWLLHERTRDLDLDIFALFSTIACVWGSQHVASYAAANQFLDSLAHHRRALGLPALVVNWGLWAGGSHLFDEEVLKFLKSVGLKRMASERNIGALMRLLAGKETQMVVAGADWHRFKPLLEARGPRPLLEAIAVRSKVGPEPYTGSDILSRLEGAGPDDLLRIIDGYVWEQYANLLGVDVGKIKAKLEDGGSLMDFGLNSLLVMEMVSRCRKDLRLEIKARDFINCPGLQWPDFLVAAITEQHGAADLVAAQ